MFPIKKELGFTIFYFRTLHGGETLGRVGGGSSLKDNYYHCTTSHGNLLLPKYEIKWCNQDSEKASFQQQTVPARQDCDVSSITLNLSTLVHNHTTH